MLELGSAAKFAIVRSEHLREIRCTVTPDEYHVPKSQAFIGLLDEGSRAYICCGAMVPQAGVGLQAVRLADVADAARQHSGTARRCRRVPLQSDSLSLWLLGKHSSIKTIPRSDRQEEDTSVDWQDVLLGA